MSIVVRNGRELRGVETLDKLTRHSSTYKIINVKIKHTQREVSDQHLAAEAAVKARRQVTKNQRKSKGRVFERHWDGEARAEEDHIDKDWSRE